MSGAAQLIPDLSAKSESPSEETPKLTPVLVASLQFQMTFHLFIAAFVGAALTLVALVRLTSPPHPTIILLVSAAGSALWTGSCSPWSWMGEGASSSPAAPFCTGDAGI